MKAFGIVALWMLGFAPAAFGDTLVVDTTSAADVGGHTTLSDAITEANTAGGANTIQFAPALGTVQVPATGLPAITDSGLKIDGCANVNGGAGHGGCQQISTAAAVDGSTGDGIIEVNATDVALTGLKLDDSGGGANNVDTPIVFAEPAAGSLTMTDDTLTGNSAMNTPIIRAQSDDLLIGGLNPSTHQPSGGITITGSPSWGIQVDSGQNDLIEGNTIGVENTGGGRGGIYFDGSSGKIIANTLTVPSANGGDGVQVGADAVDAEIGDANLQAPPNTFNGFEFGVELNSGGIAYFYDNTGTVTGSHFYVVDTQTASSPTISADAAGVAGADANGTISGTAPAGSQVLLIGSNTMSPPPGGIDELDGVEAKVQADGSGHWSWTPPAYAALDGYITAIANVAGQGGTEPISWRRPTLETTVSAVHNSVTASSASDGVVCLATSTCWAPAGAVINFTYHSDSNNGWGLRSWGGGLCPGTFGSIPGADPTCSVQVAGASNTAVSEWLEVQLTVPGGTGGSVSAATTGDGGCGYSAPTATCFVPPGSTVTLTASPQSSYELAGWGNVVNNFCRPSATTCVLSNLQNPIIDTPSFQRAQFFTVKWTVSPSGDGAVSGTATGQGAACGTSQCSVPPGGTVTLKAVAAQGSQFSSWTGCSGLQVSTNATTATCSFPNLQASQTVAAQFSDVVPVSNGPVKLSASGGVIGVVCGGSPGGRCVGTLTLALAPHHAADATAARAGTVLATGHFSIPGGKRGTVRLKLAGSGRSYERAHRHKSVAATETIVARDASGKHVRISRSVKVRLG